MSFVGTPRADLGQVPHPGPGPALSHTQTLLSMFWAEQLLTVLTKFKLVKVVVC